MMVKLINVIATTIITLNNIMIIISTCLMKTMITVIITMMIIINDCDVDWHDHYVYHYNHDYPGQSGYEEREKIMIIIMISIITIIINRLSPSHGKET